MAKDLTTGPITAGLLRFALPLMAGNLLQQMYNICDTWVVGRFLGPAALGAVGSSYALMVFLTSIFLGLCMGSGAAMAMAYGKRDMEGFKSSMVLSFLLIAAVTVILSIVVFAGLDEIIRWLRMSAETAPLMRAYLWIVFWGLGATFLYNYFANLLRAVGDSLTPLIFLGISSVLNIILDLWFILALDWQIQGAAVATVLAQIFSGMGLALYTFWRLPALRPARRHFRYNGAIAATIANLSFLTCLQQSVMNFGILMVQGLVNSFGTVIMAAFAAAVKIDSLAYMPVQDFGNAFAIYIAQNYGAGQKQRIKDGTRSAITTVFLFCLILSPAICLLARPLMTIFVDPSEIAIIAAGVHYLRIEAACYIGIGILFLLYGFYRAINRPFMSVVLTIISLGTRVSLAYTLSAIPAIGVTGIWVSIPIGWLLADICGAILCRKYLRQSFFG